jgi:hypothetical protein
MRIRQAANLADEDHECPVCGEYFEEGQKIFFNYDRRPVHKRKCKILFQAEAVNIFGLEVREITESFGVSVRQAYRIVRKAREQELEGI